MKRNVYVETSVISYLAARPSSNLIGAARQASSWQWWTARERFDVFVSVLVWRECGQGDVSAAKRRTALLDGIPVLGVTQADVELASELIGRGAFPPKPAMMRYTWRSQPATEWSCWQPGTFGT